MQLYFSLALLAFTISHTYALPIMEGSDSVAVFKRDDGSMMADLVKRHTGFIGTSDESEVLRKCFQAGIRTGQSIDQCTEKTLHKLLNQGSGKQLHDEVAWDLLLKCQTEKANLVDATKTCAALELLVPFRHDMYWEYLKQQKEKEKQ